MHLSMLECIPLSVIRVLSYFHMKEPLGLNWLAQETLCCVRVLQMALSKCYSQCVYVKEVAARVRCSNYHTVVSFPTCGQRLLHNWYTKDKGLLT